MANNITLNNDIAITVREVDFVTRFATQWDHLREIMGIMRPIKKQAGTKITSKYATVALEDGNVPEGENIPYSHAEVKEKEYATIAIKKYAKAVSIEAIDAKDYENAVQRTDDEFLNELQTVVVDDFYSYIRTGTLRSAEGSFQMALAMAQGRVRDKWKKMHKGITAIVGFCNILDAYSYLGAANITVQTQYGMDYIENFLGYSKLFLSSEIPSGEVIATPTDNIVLYYVDPSDSQFARAGLSYTTDGETNLIGFHTEGNYRNAVSESFALMGMTLFAEYLDGIAVVSINSSLLSSPTVAAEAQGTSLWEVPVSSIQGTNLRFTGESVVGTSKYLPAGNAITNVWGAGNFVAFKISDIDSNATSVKVGLTPSAGTGLVEIINDPDKNGIFKITDKANQKFTVVTSDGVVSTTKYYDLSGITLETE